MGLLLQTPRARLRRALIAVAAPYRPPDESPLCGRVVMVTGASSGIGEATARAAAEAGAHRAARRPPRRGAGRLEASIGAARRAGDVVPVRPHRPRRPRRARGAGAGRARRRRLPRQQRRPLDPPLAAPQPGPLPRRRAHDGRQLLRAGAAHDGAAAGDAGAAVRPRGEHRELGRAAEGAEVLRLPRLQDRARHLGPDRRARGVRRQRHGHQHALRAGAHARWSRRPTSTPAAAR